MDRGICRRAGRIGYRRVRRRYRRKYAAHSGSDLRGTRISGYLARSKEKCGKCQSDFTGDRQGNRPRHWDGRRMDDREDSKPRAGSPGRKRDAPMKTKKKNLAEKPLSRDLLQKMNAYWRAANYLSVGQIYLYDNPLLKEPLKLSHIKPRLLGHWGTTPGLNFIYVHLNRIINQYGLNLI